MMFQRLEFQIVEATGNQPVSCVMQCVCSHLSVLPFDWLVHGNPESPEGSVMALHRIFMDIQLFPKQIMYLYFPGVTYFSPSS